MALRVAAGSSTIATMAADAVHVLGATSIFARRHVRHHRVVVMYVC
jgi:hypothetical protein